MPVYLLTVHAYRSWHEDHPRGFVRHGRGLQAPGSNLAHWRNDVAKCAPVCFDLAQQEILHAVIERLDVASRADGTETISPHGVATCPTHAHDLFSFRSPACICGLTEHCRHDCPARRHAQRYAARLKRQMGYDLACKADGAGQSWFSRGWDLSPVRQREHFDYLMIQYLPDHQHTQGGLFRAHPRKTK